MDSLLTGPLASGFKLAATNGQKNAPNFGIGTPGWLDRERFLSKEWA
jgi:hypothetical protein